MIIIGTTLAAFAMSKKDAWSSWFINAEMQKESHPEGVKHFAAIQLDARGLEPFGPFIEKLTGLGGEYFTYSLDDGRTSVTMTNRWRHITFGQNIVTDYAQSITDCTHLLFMAADCAASPDVIPKMLEMNHPLVAPYISTYGLRGPVVERYPFHVEEAMASAAAIFIARSVFRSIRWRWDMETHMSDDPCFHHDALNLLNVPTYVRHDCTAQHYPIAVGAYESRFNPKDLEIHK